MTTVRPRARKGLGQHWLVDRRTLARIVRAAGITDDDTVVEVGAGSGLLTDMLAQRAKRLIAIELDAALAERLRERFGGREGVTIVEGDVLETSPERLLAAGGGGLPYLVVGNLPYFIGTAILRRFLADPVQPRRVVATLQAEVARNIAAKPGDMSYLSVEMQYYAEPRLLFEVPASAFRPAPKVRSAVLRLDTRDGMAVEVDDRERFFEFVRAGFAAPRKQLRNALAIGLGHEAEDVEEMLADADMDGRRRAQTLTLEEWRRLYRACPGGRR